MILKLDTKGNEKQKQCCADWVNPEVREIVYGGSKYSGKSFLGCSIIFAQALIYPDTMYFIARKKLSDIVRYTMPSISEVFKIWGIDIQKYARFKGDYNYFQCYNKSRVYLVDAAFQPSDPEYQRFGSMQMTQGWIEEGGEFDDKAATNLIITAGRWNNEKYGLTKKILITCNPSKNFLYREFYKPFKTGKLDADKRFVQALPQDNKAGDQNYIDDLFRKLKGSERKRLLFGDWEYDDSPDILINYEKAIDIFTNTHVAEGAKYITADLARMGADKVVIIEWSGMRGKVTAYTKEKLDYTTSKIEATRIRMGIGRSSVLVDAGGLGSGVEDFGGFKGFIANARPLPDPKKPVDANGKPVIENFDMLKSQCGYRMAEIINNSGLYLECDESLQEMIIEELEQVKQKKMDSDMKHGLLPKDKVKELLGRSPDFWDAVLMRAWFELKPTFVPTATPI